MPPPPGVAHAVYSAPGAGRGARSRVRYTLSERARRGGSCVYGYWDGGAAGRYVECGEGELERLACPEAAAACRKLAAALERRPAVLRHCYAARVLAARRGAGAGAAVATLFVDQRALAAMGAGEAARVRAEAERLGGELAREGVGLLTSGFVAIGGDEGEVRGARPRRGILLSLSLSFLADVVKSG